jgi:hypothetical protein
MTDFEHQLTDLLRERADHTTVTLDLDAIKSGKALSSPSGTVRPRISWRTAAGVAASAAVVVAGLVAIAQSRSDITPPAASPPAPPVDNSAPVDDPYGALPTTGPTIDDHWHVAYGINLCGTWAQLAGDLEQRNAQDEVINEDYIATGIHSHDDGLIHIHPFTEAGAGTNATLGVFFKNYGIELNDDGLVFGQEAGNEELQAAYDRCGHGQFEPVVIVWPDINSPDENVIVDHSLAGTPLGDDRMAIALVFADNPTAIEQPPSAAIDLPSVDNDGDVATGDEDSIRPETPQP